MREMDRQRLGDPLLRVEADEGLAGPSGHAGKPEAAQGLVRVMGLRAIYRRPRTSQQAPEHRVYPYLLRNARVNRPNQVWATDITYLPIARGFLSAPMPKIPPPLTELAGRVGGRSGSLY